VRSPAAALVAALLLLAPAVRAVPPDARLSLQGKKPSIQKADTGFTGVDSDAPEIVRAELLPTGELLLEPQGPGLARVFLFAPRLVRVLEIAVDVALPSAIEAALPLGCGSATEAKIASAACYTAWRARLSATLSADAPAVSFEDQGLHAQLAAAQVELVKAGLPTVQIAVTPFGIRIKGAKDESERRRALRAAWSALLGPLRLE